MNVVDLRSPDAKSRALCGGKGAELAALLGDSLPVPDGFVVTTTAFSSFLEANELDRPCLELRNAGSERSAMLAEQLRHRIASTGFPDSLHDEVARRLAGFERDGEQPQLWAVRSSAIAEDTDSASFAGQYDTTLGAHAAEVPQAIRHVWSSMFSERAVRYRDERGATDDRMAVVVQRLLRPDTAGVCFTVDPVSGADQIVINANYGLGESVVAGFATPDTYVVDGQTFAVLSALTGSKATQVVASERGVKTVEVPDHKQQALCLGQGQATEIAKLASRVANRHGGPVDIEWAYANGALHLLQARAITANPTAAGVPAPGWAPANNTPIDPRYPLYSNGNISEVLPGCVSPLSWDHSGRLIEHAFRSQLAALGALDDATGPSVLGFFFHRPYVNVSLLIDAASRTPGMTPDTVLEEFVGKPDTTTPAVTAADFMPHRLPRLWRVVWTVLRHATALPARIEGCQRAAEADSVQVSPEWLASASDEALLERVRMSDDLGAPSVVHVWASTLASVAFTQLRRRTSSWLQDTDGALASGLVTGIEGLPSAEPALALQALSAKVAASSSLATLFRGDADDATLRDALRGDPLQADLSAFLRRYGHRGVAEAELKRPCWREDPAQLISLIRNNLRPGAATPVDLRERQKRAHKEALSRLDGLSWWRRRWLGLLIERARAGFLQRETMKDLVIRGLDRSRLVYREINRRLVSRGLTTSPDDMFFLLWAEVQSLVAGNRSKEDIVRVIDERKRDYLWSLQVEVPKLQEGTARTLDADDAPAGLELGGMGVSPGRVTGVARVVTDPRSNAYIEPGEILVAPVTDVAWTPLFAQAAGLVVEVGGLLSHGSIVAREYGVPAVVGVAGATRTIQTGDRISLDGATGRVFKLGGAEGVP